MLKEVGWTGGARNKLWRYNQHYFDDLNARSHENRYEWHKDLLSRWVDANPPSEGDGWEPYPTSLRIVNWVKWSLSGHNLPKECVESLAVQARWLMRRLEFHLLGNHLFANAKALVFAGLYFNGPEANNWLSKGCGILKPQLAEQVLADGGHFERSTMYHALALEDILDTINVLRVYGAQNRLSEVLADLEQIVEPMRNWLVAMSHQDGEIGFFNDSAIGVAPSVSELSNYAARLGFIESPVLRPLDPNDSVTVKSLSTSGYVRIDADSACLLLDVAPIGPDYLPGHAHADTLSFELSVSGQRVFVNSGTSVYGIGAERLRQRGTSAHNTVMVGRKDSSEVWSGFRVARRAYPLGLRVDFQTEQVTVHCAHDGYQKMLRPPVTHEREWKVSFRQLDITDRLLPATTSTSHTAEARYHLHPDIRIESGETPSEASLLLPGGQRVTLSSSAPINQISTTYHPRFGVSEPTTCLSIQLEHGTASFSARW